MSEKTVTITIGEGNILFQVSLGFALPEQLGDKKYSVAERSLADRQVGKLFLALKKESPLYVSQKQVTAFGPESAWELKNGSSGAETFRLAKPKETVDLLLKKEVKNGMIWCLLVILHPQSKTVFGAGQQAENIWPVAEKLGCVRMLRDEIGLPDNEEAEKSPWDKQKSDDDYKVEKSSESTALEKS